MLFNRVSYTSFWVHTSTIKNFSLLINKNILPIRIWFWLRNIMIWSCEDLFSIWVIIELNTLTFIGILLPLCLSTELIIRYFLTQAIASLIFLLRLYFSMAFYYIPPIINLLLLILCLKIGRVPFQIWAWSVIIGLQWKGIWLLRIIQKLIPLLILENTLAERRTWLWLIGLLTILISNITNISRKNIKPFIVIRRIASIGWLLAITALRNRLWKFYLRTYAFLLYLVIKETKETPTTITLVIFLSLRGLPPLLGFFPKLMITSYILNFNLIALMLSLIILAILEIYVAFRLRFIRIFKTKRLPPLITQNKKKFWITILILVTSIIRITWTI